MSDGIKKLLKLILIVFGIFLFFKFIFRLILPFVIAFLFASLFNRPIKILNRRTGIKKHFLSAAIVLIAVGIFGFITFLIINRLITEIERFTLSVSENADRYIGQFFEILDRIAEKIPFIDAIGGNLSETVASSVKNIISDWVLRLPEFIAYIIGMLPEILLFTVILIMASYYFCTDYDSIIENFFSFLPEKAKTVFVTLKRRLTNTGISYIKACFILMFITYVELLVGFLMLNIQYAFTLALIVAAVDMLPILGVGTVLIPWTIWAWISGDTYTAVGLLIINVTATVVRRFIEPRVISSGIGLSPLITLFSMYVGFRLFGFTGLFFSPLVAIFILLLLPENISCRLGFKLNEEEKEDFLKKANKISKKT